MLARLRAKRNQENDNVSNDFKESFRTDGDKERSITVSAEVSLPEERWQCWPRSEGSPIQFSTDRFGNQIELNIDQIRFVRLATAGFDCILLGAAGTGKTTVTKRAVQELIDIGKAGVLRGQHNYLIEGTPGIICCSYTRRAVTNIKKNMTDDMKANCITIHKLLEFYPKQFEIDDPETGEKKITMKFVPKRDRYYKLDDSIRTLIIDESSMLGTDLFTLLMDALPRHVQLIFIGDIQQLPPIFSPAILGFKIIDLKENTVELTQVYRQALESPIIRLAHRILSGKPVPVKEFDEWKSPNLTIHPWKKKIHFDNANYNFGIFITKAIDIGEFDIESDIVLCPFNKQFGTLEINKVISTHLARKEKKTVYEIVAGFNRHYFAVNDRVMFDKEDATITKITFNGSYAGALPQKESVDLDYWGRLNATGSTEKTGVSVSDDDVDDFLDTVMASGTGDDERVNQASHRIYLRMTDTDAEIEIDTAAEINALLHGYAITVHKAQGSEWRKVILAFHQSHAPMLQREMLYTAVTRARETLYVICEPETFIKGIVSQRYPGDTLDQKAEYFKGKSEEKKQLIMRGILK